MHDVAFHDAILRATHNRLFLQLIDQMREVPVFARTVSVTASPDRVPESQQGHSAAFEAIRARSPERARKAMADHLGWAERVNVTAYRGAHAAARGCAGGQKKVIERDLWHARAEESMSAGASIGRSESTQGASERRRSGSTTRRDPV